MKLIEIGIDGFFVMNSMHLGNISKVATDYLSFL